MVANVKEEKLRMTSFFPTHEMKKGPWKPEEDMILIEYVKKHGERDWNMVRKHFGLARCGKSCRLRWNNHLRPNLRKGPFSPEEEKLICELHSKIGNKWARIATMLPGRTDNEIKNFWNTRVKRLARKGAPLYPLDIHSPQSNLLNPYLHHINGQNNQSSSPPPTSSSTLQHNFQTQISPTTPTSHNFLFPPPTSPSQPQQYPHYDAVLQNSMALYDAALENSRQQHQQQMFASMLNNNNNNAMSTSHRSVPNLTISVPPVRHVALHPFSPLGQSVSMANTPTTLSYMQVSPMASPHSYASSPTSMVVSPTALQLGIPMSTSHPSFRIPVSSCSPMEMNMVRPTSLPRTTSFSFDKLLFDLNPNTLELEQNNQMQEIDCNNDLAFSVEDLGISMIEEGQGATEMKFEEADFSTEQAKAFLDELDTNLNESRLNCPTSGHNEMDLQDDFSNLLDSSEVFLLENVNNDNELVSHSQANSSQLDGHMGMEMQHQLTSSVPVVAAMQSWDVLPGVY